MTSYEQATQEMRDAFDALCKGRVKAAVEAEREACAKVCDTTWDGDAYTYDYTEACNECAAAIRDRGSKT